jgi:hypothetical protein
MLAFWLQGDFNEIDHYFSQSALYREKWERADYKRSTINKAIDSCGGKYYTPPGRPKTKKEKAKREFSSEEQDILDNYVAKYGIYDDEKLTISGVALYLEQNGISVKYNETIREAEFNPRIGKNSPASLSGEMNCQALCKKFCIILVAR